MVWASKKKAPVAERGNRMELLWKNRECWGKKERKANCRLNKSWWKSEKNW